MVGHTELTINCIKLVDTPSKRARNVRIRHNNNIQCVSGGIVNILGGGSMDYSESISSH